MNSGKIVAGGRVDGTEIEGSIRGPRGPKNAMESKIVEPFIQYSGDPMCERVAEWHMQIIHSASNSGEEGLAWRHLHL